MTTRTTRRPQVRPAVEPGDIRQLARAIVAIAARIAMEQKAVQSVNEKRAA